MGTGQAQAVPGRALRKDAQLNRVALLRAAAEVFALAGLEAPLEEVARRAGVGIGTLYRHFPTRDALVEAAYRHGVEQLEIGFRRRAGAGAGHRRFMGDRVADCLGVRAVEGQ